MALEGLPIYFLASNSADGFINGFSNVYDPKNGWKAYLIKGGPGTGKSSFMKKVATYFLSKGEAVELVPCSSDPDSLDAVILNDKKIIILDATAPHIMDPVYPGVCEEILNFGQFWDTSLLKDNREEIIALTDNNKALHRRASRILSAIGQLKRNEMKISLLATDIDKTFDYAVRLAGRYIKPQKGQASERVIYLSAVTPKGNIFYRDTIDKLCSEKVIILDEYSTVSNMIFSVIRDYALKNGAQIITVKNNILPGEQIDHILIPSLSLAFCSSRGEMEINDEAVRKIHATRFMNRDVLREARSRILFGRRLNKELLVGAVNTLKEAKDVHDKLESYYIKAMDFDGLSGFFENFVHEIS
jgi:hypothetical protein